MDIVVKQFFRSRDILFQEIVVYIICVVGAELFQKRYYNGFYCRGYLGVIMSFCFRCIELGLVFVYKMSLEFMLVCGRIRSFVLSVDIFIRTRGECQVGKYFQGNIQLVDYIDYCWVYKNELVYFLYIFVVCLRGRKF